MKISKIFIASDHAGFNVKELCKSVILDMGFKAVDLGTDSAKISVDYPDFAYKLSDEVQKDDEFYGILICGTGIGISIAANRNKSVRCALCHDETDAKLAREHNNANIIAFGARTTSNEMVKKMCEVFFTTDFEGGRHERRVKKLKRS